MPATSLRDASRAGTILTRPYAFMCPAPRTGMRHMGHQGSIIRLDSAGIPSSVPSLIASFIPSRHEGITAAARTSCWTVLGRRIGQSRDRHVPRLSPRDPRAPMPGAPGFFFLRGFLLFNQVTPQRKQLRRSQRQGATSGCAVEHRCLRPCDSLSFPHSPGRNLSRFLVKNLLENYRRVVKMLSTGAS